MRKVLEALSTMRSNANVTFNLGGDEPADESCGCDDGGCCCCLGDRLLLEAVVCSVFVVPLVVSAV
eukprot:scaffold45584_cov39-Attheya_sp.AAC.3